MTPALLLAAALAAAPAPLPAYGPPTVLFRLADPSLDELSGLVAGSRPGVLFAHEDSGASASFVALGRTGRTRTTFRVPGVTAVDWEDVSRGPDERGESCLWFADTGDNRETRDTVTVVRVREPVVGDAATETTEAPDVFRFSYPDGPHDAEALLVSPDSGRLWVVTKTLGSAGVYEAPDLRAGATQELIRTGTVPLAPTGTPGGPAGLAGQIAVTGGAVAPDAARVALRTYTDLYEWPVTRDDLGAALTGTPTRTALPASPQGEAVAYRADGRAVLVAGEGARSTVVELPVGRAAGAEPSPTATPAPAPARPRPESHPYVVPAVAAVLAGITWLYRRRRRPLPSRRELRARGR